MLPTGDTVVEMVESLVKRLLYRHPFMVSQADQDRWVIGEAFNEKRNGYFLDIGAHDGVEISNTCLFETMYNWTGLCIEANSMTFDILRRNRKVVCLAAPVADTCGGCAI